MDDEQDILEQAELFMGKEDERFDIVTCSSVEEGQKRLEDEEFNVVISDYQMPETDGLAFLESLREAGNDIPFIIITGRGHEEAAMEALNLGADRYFQKGGDPEAQFSVLKGAAEQLAERQWIEERNEFLTTLLSRDLKKKVEVIRGSLESLKDLDIPEEGEKLLSGALEDVNESSELIEEVETLKESGRRGEVEKVDLDVLGTFLGYGWSETQMMLSKLWKAYKEVDEFNEVFFDLAHNSAEHKSLIEKISSNLNGFDKERYSEISDVEDFDLKGKSDEEIITEILEEEQLILDVYKKLYSLADRDLVKKAWKGTKSEDYFDILERLVNEAEEHIGKLERAKKYIAFGVSPSKGKGVDNLSDIQED